MVSVGGRNVFSLKDLLNAMCARYSWLPVDTVVLKYWSIVEDSFIPLADDTAIGYLFVQSATE